MKKRGLNITDIVIILVLAACIVGVVVRAAGIKNVNDDKKTEYLVSFTAQTDMKQLETVSAGLKLSDGAEMTGEMLEGYWIKQTDTGAEISFEMKVFGRMTESGFLIGDKYYYIGDTVTLNGRDVTFKAVISALSEVRRSDKKAQTMSK